MRSSGAVHPSAFLYPSPAAAAANMAGISDASGTLLLDVKQRAWCKPLIERLELDPAILPRVYESEEVSGALTAINTNAHLYLFAPDTFASYH